MGHKLLTFLGTYPYKEVHYLFGDMMSSPTRFVQEALAELSCRGWGPNDCVVVFMTEESRKKNWLDKKECEKANFEEGLRTRLNKAKERLGAEFRLKEVLIPEGKSEEELWKIFDRICSNLQEGDIVMLDITHSFRSLPMLSFISLNYIRFLKGIKIEKVVYGAMESLGPPNQVERMPLEDRKVPIFDLTSFVELSDWTIAVERFLETGSADMIRQLSIESLRPVLAQTKGRIGSKIRKLVKSLDRFSQVISTCRAPEIRSSVEAILKFIPEAEEEIETLKAFKPLFNQIKERFSGMSLEDDVVLGLEAASWCLEKNLIQQGFTILREVMVNYVLLRELGESDLMDRQSRELAECLLNTEARLLERGKRALRIKEEILNLWRDMVDYRNDMNHAGWREDLHPPDSFRTKLEEFIERAKRCLVENQPE